MQESGSRAKIQIRIWMGQTATLAIFIALAALVSVVLLLDVNALVLGRPGEILNHVTASAGFTLAASGIFLALAKSRPPALVLMAVGAMITISLEIVQVLIPARHAEVDDLLAGLSGVLLATIVIEAALQLWDHRVALHVHRFAAGLGAIGLAVLLVVNGSPGTLQTSQPNGETCPRTAIPAAGARLTIGRNAVIHEGCLHTESGGLGLMGKATADDLFDRSVLVSSELAELRDHMHDSGKLHVRMEIVTDDFHTDGRAMIALLRTNDGRHVVSIASSQNRLAVAGPNLTDLGQANVGAPRLLPDSQHIVDVILSPSELAVHVDGHEISRAVVDPDWYLELANEDLQLLVGNNAHRSRPFHGVVEWIELSS